MNIINFKQKYKGHWDRTSRKEQEVKALLEHNTNMTFVLNGFMAGDSGYVEHFNEEAGVPDIKLASCNLFVEVTGTNHEINNTFWIAKHKIQYALNHPEHDVFIVFYNFDDLYCLHLTKTILNHELRFIPTRETLKDGTIFYLFDKRYFKSLDYLYEYISLHRGDYER
jgi:hypothetical protein